MSKWTQTTNHHYILLGLIDRCTASAVAETLIHHTGKGTQAHNTARWVMEIKKCYCGKLTTLTEWKAGLVLNIGSTRKEMLLSITELCWKDTHNKCCLSVSTLLYEGFICFTSDSSSYNLFSVNQRWIPHFTIPLRGINKKRRWDDINVSVSPFSHYPLLFSTTSKSK